MKSGQPKYPVEAYILIKAEPGQAWTAHDQLYKRFAHKKRGGVELLSAYVVSGEYDLIAFVGGPNVKAISHFVTDEIQLLHSSPNRLIRETITAFGTDWPHG